MPCPVGVVEQFSSYALCSPNLWMIIGCTFMTLLTMILMFYLHFGFRRDLKFLKFCDWKLQQLAERLRFQEPNVTLLERITRKVNEKNYDDTPNFQDFFRKDSKVPKEKPSPGATTDVAAKVKKAKDEDAAKKSIKNRTEDVSKMTSMFHNYLVLSSILKFSLFRFHGKVLIKAVVNYERCNLSMMEESISTLLNSVEEFEEAIKKKKAGLGETPKLEYCEIIGGSPNETTDQTQSDEKE